MEHGAENIHFLRDLAVVMMVAGLVTVIFRRFNQPVVLGYILAGVIIGPHVLPSPLIASEASVQTLAELGVVLLLFLIGLELSPQALWRMRSCIVAWAMGYLITPPSVPMPRCSSKGA